MKQRRWLTRREACAGLAGVALGVGAGNERAEAACRMLAGKAGKAARPPLKFALLVGVAKHSFKDNDLLGPENDVPVIRQMLIERYHFKPENITVLMSAQATRANIIQAFEDRLIKGVQPGDLAFFYYSGHGTLVPARHPEEEETGYDSSLCPYDMHTKTQGIIDDDLGALVDRIPTEEVAIIVDACHSGSGNRPGRKTRSIPAKEWGGAPANLPAPDKVKAKQSAPFTRTSSSDLGKECYIGAAQDREEAGDEPLLLAETASQSGANPNMGVLTYFLLQALREDVGCQLTYESLVDRVRILIHKADYEQTPSVHGANVGRKRFLMLPNEAESDPVPAPLPNDPVKPILTVAAEVTNVQGKTVTLRTMGGASLPVGSVLEAVEGRKFVVVDADVKRGGERAAVQITSVSGLTAAGRLLSGMVQAGTRLVETFVAVDVSRLRIALTGQVEKAVALRQTLAGLNFVALVPAAEARDLELAIEFTRSGEIQITPFRNGYALPRIAAADAPRWAENWYAIKLLSNLKNPNPALRLTSRIDGRPSPVETHIGSRVAIEVSPDADAYIYVFDVGADGKISYTGGNLIRRGENVRFGATAKPPAGQDMVKIVASTNPLNLPILAQNGASEEVSAQIARTILEQLKREINRVSNRSLDFDTVTISGTPVSTQGWAADDIVLRILP